MQAYLWTKTAHLVFVIAWMSCVFYLPRILVNLSEAGEVPAVRTRLELMGRRLYRFGHVMFGLAFVLGLVLWLYFGIAGGWLHAKLGLVALLIGPPVAALLTGQGNAGMLGLALWPVLVLVVIWRSRLDVDRDGVDFTIITTRHVAWSDIEALVATSKASGLRGPHLRVRDGRPVPLNPLWRVDGKTVPAAIEPWARRKRVRIEGEVGAPRSRARMLGIVVLAALPGVVAAVLPAHRGARIDVLRAVVSE